MFQTSKGLKKNWVPLKKFALIWRVCVGFEHTAFALIFFKDSAA
jgi:hypothetical protein